MDLSKIPLMNAIAKRMDWLTNKQQVISQNIANANTPNYRSKVLDAPDFQGLVERSMNAGSGSKLAVQKTNSKHMASAGSVNMRGGRVVVDSRASESTPTGNNVVLEDQMLDMAKTQMDYNTMINLYRKQVGLVRTALGKSR